MFAGVVLGLFEVKSSPTAESVEDLFMPVWVNAGSVAGRRFGFCCGLSAGRRRVIAIIAESNVAG